MADIKTGKGAREDGRGASIKVSKAPVAALSVENLEARSLRLVFLLTDAINREPFSPTKKVAEVDVGSVLLPTIKKLSPIEAKELMEIIEQSFEDIEQQSAHDLIYRIRTQKFPTTPLPQELQTLKTLTSLLSAIEGKDAYEPTVIGSALEIFNNMPASLQQDVSVLERLMERLKQAKNRVIKPANNTAQTVQNNLRVNAVLKTSAYIASTLEPNEVTPKGIGKIIDALVKMAESVSAIEARGKCLDIEDACGSKAGELTAKQAVKIIKNA